MKVFAAIDVGSYEIAMKIYEYSQRGGMKQIDHIRHRVELGTDTYATGKISRERVDELCEVLSQFKDIMKAYRVDAYKACGTSAIRETENTVIVLEQIKLRTGLDVTVLSNSEQRFLHYKAVASRGEMFAETIKNSSAIIDIGGGSIQISLFDNEALVATQNIRLGILRIKEMLLSLQARTTNYEQLLSELIDNQLDSFKSLYLSERDIKNIIVVDDYVSGVIKKINDGRDVISKKELKEIVEDFRGKSSEQIAKLLKIDEESATLLPQSVVLLKKIVEMTGAKNIWAPGVSLADGIAYEYAEQNRLLKNKHDFEADITAGAEVMCRRYGGNIERNRLVWKVATDIFDYTKKLHGMGKRECLLLQVAAMLADCGKYISLEASAECGYDIIMATEMIGLSHVEREIIANIVRFNKTHFRYYKEIAAASMMDSETYLKVAKLTAIFRVADGICRSSRVKVSDLKLNLKDDEFIITIYSDEDFSLEKGFFKRKSDFFEEVFSIKPVLRAKKRVNTI